jgi:hypothetical protein
MLNRDALQDRINEACASPGHIHREVSKLMFELFHERQQVQEQLAEEQEKVGRLEQEVDDLEKSLKEHLARAESYTARWENVERAVREAQAKLQQEITIRGTIDEALLASILKPIRWDLRRLVHEAGRHREMMVQIAENIAMQTGDSRLLDFFRALPAHTMLILTLKGGFSVKNLLKYLVRDELDERFNFRPTAGAQTIQIEPGEASNCEKQG